MKSQSTINRHLRELRELINTTPDPVIARVAYAMEFAVRWARQDVVSWPSLVEEAAIEAQLLRRETNTEKTPAKI